MQGLPRETMLAAAAAACVQETAENLGQGPAAVSSGQALRGLTTAFPSASQYGAPERFC